MANPTNKPINPALRNTLIQQEDVLDRVKTLFLLKNISAAPAEILASYFGVAQEEIVICYQDNKAEIDTDGVYVIPYRDIFNLYQQWIRVGYGKAILELPQLPAFSIPKRGLRVYPKRAILRIAMLLPISEVAAKVRTELINLLNNSNTAQANINQAKEQVLLNNIAQAVHDGDVQKMKVAFLDVIALKCGISNLTIGPDQLFESNGQVKIRKAVTALSKKKHIPVHLIWQDFYKMLDREYNISLPIRAHQNLLKLCEG